MKYLIKLITVIFILISHSACQNVDTIGPLVSFEDERLEQFVESLVNENESTSLDELHTITKIDLTDYGVINLEGIHVFEGLEEIVLSGNELESLEPLLALHNLKMVNLENASFDTEGNSTDVKVIQELIERQVEVIYDQEEEQIFSKGLLFEVNNNDNTIYLFGSIHINSEELFPLHPYIEEAFEQADQVAFVVNINEKDEVAIMQAMVELGVYNDGTSLEDHITEELYNELLTFIEDYDLEQETIMRFKPWAVADMIQSLLVEDYGYSNRKNMDQYFLMKAEESQKPVMSLEHFKDQMGLSDELDLEQQEKLLMETLRDIQGSSVQTLTQLEELWMNSDIESLAALRNNKQYRDLETNAFSLALVNERDQNMAEMLDDLLEEEEGVTTFVVVNALHLIGDGNIIEHLEEYGYTVEHLFQDS